MYFTTLTKCLNEKHLCSFFLHVPLLENYSMEKQENFFRNLIDTFEGLYLKGNEEKRKKILELEIDEENDEHIDEWNKKDKEKEEKKEKEDNKEKEIEEKEEKEIEEKEENKEKEEKEEKKEKEEKEEKNNEVDKSNKESENKNAKINPDSDNKILTLNNNPRETKREELPNVQATNKNINIVTKRPSLGRARTNAEQFDLDLYKSRILEFHNELRQKHNSPPLNENEVLNDLASSYAESLSIKAQTEKDNYQKYNEEILGENIFISEYKTPEYVINKISDEKKNYDFSENKFSKSTGHFTQAIWKGTTDFGCGFCADKDKKKYNVVLLYYPAGNILGEFSQNVTSEKVE